MQELDMKESKVSSFKVKEKKTDGDGAGGDDDGIDYSQFEPVWCRAAILQNSAAPILR